MTEPTATTPNPRRIQVNVNVDWLTLIAGMLAGGLLGFIAGTVL